MTRVCYIAILVIFGFACFATHNQAGLITWEHLSGKTYKLRIITMTEINSPGGNADRCKLTIYINHQDSIILPRINGSLDQNGGNCAGTREGVDISSTKHFNIYEGTYTFLCEGKFNLSCYDPNRNANIINIPNSVNTPMYFESEIYVPKEDYLCPRGSVSILPYEITLSPQNRLRYTPYYLNKFSDSLSYTLIPCQTKDGYNIQGYSFNGFSINQTTGEISTTSTTFGEYNMCVRISMYRRGEYVGYVNYDHSVVIKSISSQAQFSNFSSNIAPTNGTYVLNPGQTFTLNGTNANSVMMYYDLASEITESVTGLTYNTNFSLTVQHTPSLARPKPYKLYVRMGTNMGFIRDTLIQVLMTGYTTITCAPMAVSTPTCELPGKKIKDFFIYPVPTGERLYFSNTNYYSIRAYDITGKHLSNLFIYENVMNTEILEPGVYILVVKLYDGRDHYYKFVKR